jgi:hypothetical protein
MIIVLLIDRGLNLCRSGPASERGDISRAGMALGLFDMTGWVALRFFIGRNR